MATAIESQIGTLTHGRHATGVAPDLTIATALADRPRWLSGVLDPAKTIGSEDYVDGLPFGSPTQFTEQVGGEVGSVTIQVQPSNSGLYFAELAGVDVVTGAADPYTHTIAFNGAVQPFGWWAQQVGASSPKRDLFYESKIGKGVFETSQGTKPMHAELSVVALRAGEIYATPAAKTEDTSDTWLHTESSGSFSLDGTVICEVGSDVLDIDRGLSAFFGDNVEACQIIPGKGQITRSVQSIATSDTLALRNRVLYGASAPAAGTRPVKAVYYAAITKTLTRSATRTLTISTPKVALNPADMKVGPSPGGGPIEMTFGGTCLKNGAAAPCTVTVLDGSAVAYI